MGWKVRSGKLALVKQTGGTTQQVRFAIAKDKIKQALAASGKSLEDGLDIADFQDLAKKGILIIDDPKNLQIGDMEKLKEQKVSLEEIKEYFIDKYSDINLKRFMDTYLNIKDNSSSSLNKFMGGKTAIKEKKFKNICNFLELDCHEIGMEDEPEMPDSKQLETLLWQFNHKKQVEEFQSLPKNHHNLVCLKFPQVSAKDIHLYWLLKTLLQPVDDSIETIPIDFQSSFFQDSQDRLNSILRRLNVFKESDTKKKPDVIAEKIAEKIYKKMEKEKKPIALLFSTQDKRHSKEFHELSDLLYQPLKDKLSDKKSEQKLLMLWIDSQPLSQVESDAFDEDYDNHQNDSRYTKIDVSSRFNNSDIMEWTNRQEVKIFINKTKTAEISSNNNIADIIWNESQEGQPEFLLKSVYTLCKLTWEEHQRSWQKL